MIEFLSSFTPYILALLGAAAAFLGHKNKVSSAEEKGVKEGREQVKHEQHEEVLEDVKDANEIEGHVESLDSGQLDDALSAVDRVWNEPEDS